MSELKRSNIRFWNELTAIHEKSSFYDVNSFLRGKQTIREVELMLLGDVRDKSLLHLQCHFGMDTLSWARAGARVTGVDFSDKAIDLANELKEKVNLEARFIRSDVYDLPNVLQEQFDIVVTTYGVLCWLQDLNHWASVIARFLKPGGTFVIVEEHPLAYILDDKCQPTDLRIAYSYFDNTTLALEAQNSYADSSAKVAEPVHYEWTHTMEEIVSSLCAGGLQIESLREYPVCMYQKFEWMIQGEDGWWRGPESQVPIPLLFSIKASKP